MSLSDPFNRVSSQQNREYQAFHQQLQQAGIDSTEKARAVQLKSRKNLLAICTAVIIIAILISVSSPDIAGIVIVFSGLILFWLIATLLRGQRMMKRYIQQEFSEE